MADIKFTNFAYSSLATGIDDTVTTIAVESGHGDRFPTIVTVGDFFYLTIENASLDREIVKVTERVGDTLTVVRGQDGTTAQSWLAGVPIALRMNAAGIEHMFNQVVRRHEVDGSALIPKGTTAERGVTPDSGYLRFNTDIGQFEGYDGVSWKRIVGADDMIVTVAGIASEVITVAGIDSEVVAVAGNEANITTVAGIDDKVTTVADNDSNVTIVADNTTNINLVAAIDDKVTTVADNDANVTIVADNIASVNTVAADIDKVITAANDLNEAVSEIEVVANNIDNVNIVGANDTNVTKVANIDGNVTTVADNDANVTIVADNTTNINLVAAIDGDVTLVAAIDGDVTTVANNDANVTKVANIDGNVTTVANNDANVTKVANIDGNVTTVANNDANVTKVANIDGDVTIVAGIDVAVTAVAGNETNINIVAGNNANVTKVANIDTAVSAVAAIDGSVTIAATNVADITNFADVYIGASATAPTTRLDSSALVAGDLYFNTSSSQMQVWNGTVWQAIGSTVNGTAARFKFLATAGQTVFTGTDANGATLGYDAGYIDVYLNGVHLDPADYTATSGDSITLLSAAALNDELYVVAFGNFVLADVVTLAGGFSGAASLPVGTTAQRPTPATGQLRFNGDEGSFEGYNGTEWGAIGGGGGASGGGNDAIFYENGQTVTTDYTITTSSNAMSTGPITINSGVSVTIPSGSRWAII